MSVRREDRKLLIVGDFYQLNAGQATILESKKYNA